MKAKKKKPKQEEPATPRIISTPEKPVDAYTSSQSIFGTSTSDKLITPDQSRELVDFLTRVPLPGVASKEQIFLIAVVETVAKTLQEGKGRKIVNRNVNIFRVSG